jgi:thymidylate kinase
VFRKEEQKVIHAVVQQWKQLGIPFAVCGGIDAGGTLHGRDLDVLVDRERVGELCTAARDYLHTEGYATWTRQKGPSLLLFCRKTDPSESAFFEIDFLSRQQWLLATFVNGSSVLRDLATSEALPFSPWAAFAKNILIQLLAGNKNKVAANLRNGCHWLASSKEVSSRLRDFVGSVAADELQKAIVTQDLAALSALSPCLRRSCVIRSLRPTRWLQLPAAAIFWVRQKWQRMGGGRLMTPIIAVVGPDGAGKSSVLQAVKGILPERFPLWGVQMRHWRPSLLPSIGAVAGKPQPEEGKPNLPRRKSGRFYFIRLAYYGVDFLAGYILKDRRLRAGLTAVLYDRCFWDMYVDPVRFGLGSRQGMLSLGRLLPGPNMIFCLDVDPETARARKGELADHEVAEQNKKWHELATKIKTPIRFLDARKPIDVNARIIANAYMDALVKMLSST